MDEASKDNGCLWGVPGSHKENPKHFMKIRKGKDGLYQSYMEPEEPDYDYSIEGALPLEVPPGSIVLIHGNVTHFSEKNTSQDK